MYADPLQFVYEHHRGVDDTILSLPHGDNTHLEKPKSFVRLVYVDFFSAFNTVQAHLMGQKLLHIDVNSCLLLWILSFLTEGIRE